MFSELMKPFGYLWEVGNMSIVCLKPTRVPKGSGKQQGTLEGQCTLALGIPRHQEISSNK